MKKLVVITRHGQRSTREPFPGETLHFKMEYMRDPRLQHTAYKATSGLLTDDGFAQNVELGQALASRYGDVFAQARGFYLHSRPYQRCYYSMQALLLGFDNATASATAVTQYESLKDPIVIIPSSPYVDSLTQHFDDSLGELTQRLNEEYGTKLDLETIYDNLHSRQDLGQASERDLANLEEIRALQNHRWVRFYQLDTPACPAKVAHIKTICGALFEFIGQRLDNGDTQVDVLCGHDSTISAAYSVLRNGEAPEATLRRPDYCDFIVLEARANGITAHARMCGQEESFPVDRALIDQFSCSQAEMAEANAREATDAAKAAIWRGQ